MCDVIVTRHWGKPVFHVVKKFIGFHSKSRGAETKHDGNEAAALKCQL